MNKKLLLLFSLLCFQYNAFSKYVPNEVFVAPPNDECANATTLTVNTGAACTSTTTASFTAATASTVPSASCATPSISGKDIWYQFTATSTVNSISLSGFTGTAQPVIMALYEGDCGSLNQIFCSANNVIVANTLTIGVTYKLRLYFNLASPSLSTAFNICVSTPPATSNLDCSINTINYSFETPTPLTGGTGPTFINHNTVQGWRTTNNDGMMEYWPSPSYEAVSAYQGTQYIELNANANQGTMGVYQDFSTPQPTIFTVKFAHRGRMGTDTCKLLAGPPGGPYEEVYTAITSNTAWVYHGQAPLAAITYEVPAGQTTTRFFFQAVSTATGDTSVGNFLDAIQFTATNIILTQNPNYMGCGEVTLDIAATGFGSWTAHADNPSVVTIADPSSQNTTISNFDEPGLYYFDWGTDNCISTLEVTFTGAEPDTPIAPPVVYCQGQTAVPLTATLDPGNTQTWYYNGNMYTTPPTPSTAALGTFTYYVSQTSPNGCESIPGPIIVSVTSGGPSTTGFTLPAAVCHGAANVLPTTATGFTNGGTFTSGTGLVINATTGEINLTTSTPGSYTVTYAIPNNPASCLHAGTSSAPITINAAPVLAEPDDLETCDDDYNGLAVFNLIPAGNQAVNGQTGLTVTYHESLSDAQLGSAAIDTPSAYPSEVANTQTIYIRAIQTGTTTNCASVKEVQLIVHPKPVVSSNTNFSECDEPTPGLVATFNLTQMSGLITGNAAGVTVTYYTTQANAQNAVSPIATPGAYNNTSSPQTVWARLVNGFGCVTVAPVTLTVNPLPAINPALDVFRECENANGQATFDLGNISTVLVNNATGYYISFFATEEDAEAADWVGELPLQYSTDDTTIYATVTDLVTACRIIVPVELEAVDVPLLVAADDLETCDDDFNGLAVFNLTTAGNQVINGQTGVTVAYYESLTDAETGGTATDIDTPAAYLSEVANTQTIYIRVTQTGTSTECYAVETVQLIVHPRPAVPTMTNYALCDDAGTPGLATTFDLTTKSAQATGNVAGVTVTYYTTQANAQAGTSPIATPETFTNTASPQTIWLRLVNSFGCVTVASFDLIVNPLPAINPNLVAFRECENADGEGSFNLPVISTVVINGASGYFISYFETQAEAETGDPADALPTPYVTASTIIYARVVNTTTNCNVVVAVELEAVAAPELIDATALEACDDNNDGHQTFNLTIAGNEVVNGQTGLTITYHETFDDADFGDNDLTAAQAAAYNSVSQSIWIRVVQAGTTDECASIEEVQLIVHPRPVIAPIPPYILCDDNNSPDGVEVFDLTTKNSEATSNATDIVAYYLTQGQATAGTGAITAPETFESATAQIWVRVENTFGCSQVAPIQLTVNPLPVIAQNMEPFYACEDTPGVGIFDFDEIDPVVTQGAAGYTVAYYLTEAQAWDGQDDYLVSEYPSPNATIYARVEDAVTGCAIVSPIVLEVLPAPIAPELEPLQECDPNNDGIATFDLTESIAIIQAALGNAIVVTVHETPEDADFGTNIVTNTGSYTNNAQIWTQTLWLRVESSQTECFDVVTLQLIVNPVPEATEPAEAYEMCDNGSNDSDGIAVFDLTQYGPIVLGSLNPAEYSVSYHASYDNAVNNITIPTPASFNSPSVPAIFIKVTNNATGCYDIVELELIVNPLPIAIQPTPLTLCDENNPGDEIEIFDLTSKIDEITESAFGVTVTFHDTYAQAVGNTDAITTPEAYPNSTPAVETIFVRVTNNETGCYRIVLLDIRVEPLPILVEPTEADLTECDTTGLGFAQFNLTELVEDMINNGAGITVAFYETEQNALDGILPISNPGSYTNAIAYEHTIYVKASSANGCQSEVYALTLHVAPAPQAPDLEDIVLCDDQDTNNQNGMAFIDLTIYEQDIYTATGAAPGTLTIHYFTTEEAADAGAPRITTPAHYNASHNQVIWVRVELADTGCYSLTRFTVKFNLPVNVVTPTMLVKCDDTLPLNDAQATFDLTQKDNEILGPLGIGLGNTVAYFETQANATNNVSPITPATAYTNPLGQNPKTLFVRVTTPQGCVSYTTLTVKVLPLPVPDTTPDALELCDITNTGDNVESFDLTQAEDDIANNDNAVTFNYYPTQADAIAEPPTNEIVPATAYVSGTGSVWVRVSASNGNANDPICYSVVELPLIVHPLPAQSAIVPYAICEQNTDGFATFDLGSQIAQILGPDADPADYTVTFRYNGNLISYSYTNVVANSQVIDVRVVHNGTGCTATVQLTLLVEEQAIAYDVTTPDFDLCDTDGNNDGALIIDLTQATADIIGTQDPAIHSVTYYPSEADALAQTNAIDNPAAYNATTMTIWAEIINTSTLSGCPDYTSFEVVIELLPEPEISTADDVRTICVDFDTQEVLRPLELRSGVTPNGHTYDWYLDGSLVDTTTNGTYMAMAPGTYTVIVTGPAPNGCVSDESEGFTVIQSGPASPIGIGYTVSNAFGESQVITVLVEGYGEYQYSLYEEGPWQNSNVFTDVAPGAHTIFVRDVTEDACDTLILEEVSIINYPHYFTPNADGYNDTWNVIGLAGEEYQAIVYIFDRYGKLIKQISPDGDGWDGTFNGTKVPADDYWFTVEFTEGLNRREFKAHFALKR